MPRTITKNTGALLIPEGGVEIPEVRDSTFSVTLVLRAGFKGTNGLHWHGRKTGMTSDLPDCSINPCHRVGKF